MKKTAFILFLQIFAAQLTAQKLNHYPADNPYIQYYGRIDFSNPLSPKLWQPGHYFTITFAGSRCEIILEDEILWGAKHNYLEIIVDGVEKRIQTKTKRDTIIVADGLTNGAHQLTVYKNTEANIGYIALSVIRCERLLSPPPKPKRKIEFIGNSITCGTGSDQSAVPCGRGVWEDQHNAYLSYGAITARALEAQSQLTAVSGIGLMHSCCNMDIIMPQVYDKISMRENKIAWNFSSYQPDLITICLGQNDGVQDSAAFCKNYMAFFRQVRKANPTAMVICLSSPMADARLAAFMKPAITSIVKTIKRSGDKKIDHYFFSKQYRNGCDYHPDLEEHEQIAKELTAFIKKTMKW